MRDERGGFRHEYIKYKRKSKIIFSESTFNLFSIVYSIPNRSGQSGAITPFCHLVDGVPKYPDRNQRDVAFSPQPRSPAFLVPTTTKRNHFALPPAPTVQKRMEALASALVIPLAAASASSPAQQAPSAQPQPAALQVSEPTRPPRAASISEPAQPPRAARFRRRRHRRNHSESPPPSSPLHTSASALNLSQNALYTAEHVADDSLPAEDADDGAGRNENTRESELTESADEGSGDAHTSPSLLSFTAFRNHARDRARLGRGPASGGDGLFGKTVFIAAILAVSLHDVKNSCDQELRPWLLCAAAGVAVYVVAVRALFVFLRPRNREMQEVGSYALYCCMWPLAFFWLAAGCVLSFGGASRGDSCRGTPIRITSLVICIIAIVYLLLVVTFVACLATISCLVAPENTARGVGNVMRNRMPTAASASAVRALKNVSFDPTDLSGCGLEGLTETACSICLEGYEAGDHLVALDCEQIVPHVFHKACIQLWFSRSAACPLCKRNI